MKNLAYLSDIIGPRLTGSEALKRANDWTAEKMKSYGLTNVRLEGYEIPVGWERGSATAKIIEPNNGRTLQIAAAGWTPGTKGKIEGDVVILKAKSSKDLAEYKGKLKGAIVLRGEPTKVAPITDLSYSPGGGRKGPIDGKTPEGKKADGKQIEGKSASEKKEGEPKRGFDRGNFEQMQAFRRELTDFMHEEGVAVILQDSGKPHGLLNMTGSWRSGGDRVSAPDPLPSAFVVHEHYALLHRLASRTDGSKTRVQIEITNKLTPGPVAVYNTVGEIKGVEKPEEFVVVGAHLDSWDLAQGTTDNGTGSCVILEVARILAKSGVKPKRTIRFVLFSGEEQGLHGSKEYVKMHKAEMPKTSAAIVHDTGTGRVLGFGLQSREILKPLMERELVSLKEVGFKEITLREMGGTDHLSFEAEEVPGFAMSQDMAEYRLTHHSQSDTLDKAKEGDLVQGAQVMAVTALRIANLPEMLPRDLPEEVKARRALNKGKGRGKEIEKAKGKEKG
jgi:carboxypeptidase Q